ncbi:hypothetical protein [Aliarcobacter lanthieri]|uniref:hypothetical protein n=1 Tax=Aliarcobacter lanthieri TaxID=1355374 RepID=UPI00047AF14C|nr:hypothetical protein [Aliarcobacter lanthieri]
MQRNGQKLNYCVHVYIGGALYSQVLRDFNSGRKTDYFLTENALQVIYNEIKYYLATNDEMITLLSKILSRKKNIKNFELLFKYFNLLKEDFLLHGIADTTLYQYNTSDLIEL